MYSNKIVELWNTEPSKGIFCISLLSVMIYWRGSGMTSRTIMRWHGGEKFTYRSEVA